MGKEEASEFITTFLTEILLRSLEEGVIHFEKEPTEKQINQDRDLCEGF